MIDSNRIVDIDEENMLKLIKITKQEKYYQNF